jgi:hypothetical protein
MQASDMPEEFVSCASGRRWAMWLTVSSTAAVTMQTDAMIPQVEQQ